MKRSGNNEMIRMAQALGLLLIGAAGLAAQVPQEAEPIEALATRAANELIKQKSSISNRVTKAIKSFQRNRAGTNKVEADKQRARVAALGRAAADDLLDYLKGSKSVQVRHEVTQLLKSALKGGASPSHNTALLALAESKSPGRAAAAWSVLGSTQDSRHIPKARAAASEAKEVDVRAAALLALAELGDPEANDVWLAALKSKEATVRTAALMAIAIRPSPALVKATVKAVDDPEEAVSVAALKALGSFPDSIDAIRRLHNTLEHRNQIKIGAALSYLNSIDKRELSGKYLRDCASKKENTYPVRYQAAQVLKSMGDDFGLMRLAAPLKKQISKQPREMGPRRSLGELYFNFNEYSRAIKELDRFLSSNPPFAERYKVNLMLAKSYAVLHLYKKAGSALAGADHVRRAEPLPRLVRRRGGGRTRVRRRSA